ncbi:hypothetical protein BGZ96_007959 [Linnemannia gamsii]|uniref:FAD-binding domain-containing protein n=1 Tax=Linnemannia gamsii TaxID=64522 RepID=A0ABQ7K1F3_9FUNG|nr:hypothetical protein BGZ96_007959 [Linnemannia gamsii]
MSTATTTSEQSQAPESSPRVLIAGGGLGGLFLGILLEKAGISYEIFERSPEIKSIGKFIHSTEHRNSPNILPAFEQMGLYEELLSFSKPLRGGGVMLTDKLEVISEVEPTPIDNGIRSGFISSSRVARHAVKQDPSSKLHMSKKVVSFEQDQDGVTLTFGDNTTARGDILVGADGANSAVHKHLYKTLEKKGLLPKADTREMNKGYISLVGTTEALDPERYPDVLKEDCQTRGIVGDGSNPYTNLLVQLGITEAAVEGVGSSDWVSQDNQKMLDEIRHFKTIYGTLGDLFDETRIEKVSKVYFEDMLFETWNHGRTILIGDAAHKLLSSTGAGAANAMQDAVILANHIYDIKPTSFVNIQAALDEYKEERFDKIKEQYPQSYMAAKLMYGHISAPFRITLWERIFRQVVFNWLPKSIQMNQLRKDSAYRPQANFLPEAPKRGTVDTISQQPSKRLQKEKEEEAKMKAAYVVAV